MAEIILQEGVPIKFLVEQKAYSGVKRIADKVREDIQDATACSCERTDAAGGSGVVIFAGTVGNSDIIAPRIGLFTT